MQKWNSDQIRRMEVFKGIKLRGYYINGQQLTDLYNEVFNTKLAPTNCSSCLNIRYQDLERSLRIFERALQEEEQKAKEEEVITEEKPKRGRPKKKEE